MGNRMLRVLSLLLFALSGPVAADDTAGAAKSAAPEAPKAPAAGPAVQAPAAPTAAPSQTPAAPSTPAKPALQAAPAPGPAAPPAVEATKRTSDPQAVAVVETYLKAIGGRETLSKIKDRVTKFRNIKHQATGETVANINLYLKDSILIREEWEIVGFDIKGEALAFVQIYNGKQEEGWVQMLGTVSPLDGRTLQVFVWDKQMDDFFCHWEEDGYALSLTGQGIVPKDIIGEETPCDIVNVADFSGRTQMRFLFSKKDGLLLKKEWQDAGTNPKATVKKEQYYKMYRDLAFMDGSGLSVKFPLKLEIYLDGDLDTERVYTNVRFNSSLSDKLFDKPEGRPFTGAPPAAGTKEKEKDKGKAAEEAGTAPTEGSASKAKGKTAAAPKTTAPASPPAEKKAEEEPKKLESPKP